jgi:Arc/MetJ family transcription regulator
MMRTTLDIDDDVLAAAKERARLRKVSAGKMVSDLLRQALSGSTAQDETRQRGVAGFRPFDARGVIVTNDDIDALRDREGV